MEHHVHHRTINLEELSSSNFEIADHQPDINGWELVDAEGNEIGEVEDLIFDPQEGKVRYIVADIDSDQENHTGYVLIPIGLVTLDDDEEEVMVSMQHTAVIYTLPPYEKGKTISPVEELAVRYAFLGAGSLPNAAAVVYEQHPEDFYNHGHFSDDHFKRSQDPG
ncbi:PRC-barrel domain-containing protein [Pedobacter heparinus]|uniref:PRC-barrel domain-containing protein n=1 Tax=Pedobacter heparinus TaxID=984 RepID=UPI00293062E6|nr:PRC-barrel domain-containing protein [Pedobacter heparinus]